MTTQKIDFGALYVAPGKGNRVDFYLREIKFPRIFEWNWLAHSILKRSCVDIDGVLCPDPKPGTDDDGPIYTKWIQNVPPRYLIRVQAKALVTCRLEKYRAVTEAWLRKHRVKYEKLFMMQYKTRAQRIKARQHGPYKAEIMQRVGAGLFIESNSLQAKRIADLTKRVVLCTDEMRMY